MACCHPTACLATYQPCVTGSQANLNSPNACLCCTAASQHPIILQPRVASILVHLNPTNSMSDTLPQGSTNAGPPAFAQQLRQGSNSSTNAQPARCHMSTSCRHVTATLCLLQHTNFMQIAWGSAHDRLTVAPQPPGTPNTCSSLASLAFSTAALNLHADHLGSAHGRATASLKALLHTYHHAEAI
jgi:hypothetical protein